VRPLPEIVEDNLLRIAQESLTNVIKHSGATTATVSLDYNTETVQLRIDDNGKGFSVNGCPGPSEGHFGLLGIRERATRLRGTVSLTSKPGTGTRVHVQIPIDAEPVTGLSETNDNGQMI